MEYQITGLEKKFATEEQMQAYCFQWFHNTFPKERKMLHCNNNNSSSRIEGNRMKAVGVVPGVSDLELIGWGGITVFIELKLPGKKQSEDQIEFERKVKERGHIYLLFQYFEEFQFFILNYLKNVS